MVRHEAAEAMGAISSVQSIPTLKEFLNDERQEVRETCEIALAKVEWDNSEEGKAETTKSQENNPLVYQYTVASPNPGFPFYYIFADSSHLRIRHRLCPRRSFGRHPLRAHCTQTPIFRLLLKPCSIRLFPCSSDTGPSSPCVISALRPRSTRSLQPCSHRTKSALPSLNMRSLLSLARCRTRIPSRRCSRPSKTRERRKWCATRRRRLWVELPQRRSCPCCGSGPLRTTRPAWSGKAVWWQLTCGRYVILSSSNSAHLY